LKLIAWADSHSWNAARSLYQRSDTSDTTMNYVEGPIVAAEGILCKTVDRSWCSRAEKLAAASAAAFPPDYHWAPVCDAIYYRFLATLSSVDGNPRWRQLAADQAALALANARDASGVFTNTWTGDPISSPRLLTPGGTLMLLAALAAGT